MSEIRTPLAELTTEEKRALAKRLMAQRATPPARPPAPPPRPAEDAQPSLAPALHNFDHHPAYLALRAKEDAMERNPYYRVHEGIAGDLTIIDGRERINFSNYNYLGLSGHPAVTAAVVAAVERYGTSVSASRMVGGERPFHAELERSLSEILDTEACLALVSGYGTNVTTLAHLFGPKDLILHDALAHNSIITGALLSGARRIAFRHNDWQAVDDLLARHRRDYERVVIVVEGVYSMDGDYPDLPRFVEIRNRHKVFLMVDEAHSLGVLGAHGFGIREHFGLRGADVDIWMGTLSKSLASCGGYIAGCRSLIFSLRFGAPGFVFSVGVSPAHGAAALAALEIMRAEPERVAALRHKAGLFLDLAKRRGLPTGLSAGVAVIPLIVGEAGPCVVLTRTLLDRGINVQPILHPAVDERSSRLRFFINATHTEAQLERSVAILDEEWRKLGGRPTLYPGL